MTTTGTRPPPYPLLLLLAALAVAGCATESGHPRPAAAADSTIAATPETPPGSTTAHTVTELPFCELLTPQDFPVQAAPTDIPLTTHYPDGCGQTISTDNGGRTFSTQLGALTTPFPNYTPPAHSPNGRHLELASRHTWLGTALTDTEHACTAAFGTADGTMVLSILDETHRGITPCTTTAALAEIVIPRTPPPTP